MANPDWTRSEMKEVASHYGLYIRTWSPGDGITRYRFFKDANNGYFGPDNGIYTALGLAEARTFVRAWQLFMQPLPPLQEHVVDCPRCGTMIVIPCEDEEDE